MERKASSGLTNTILFDFFLDRLMKVKPGSTLPEVEDVLANLADYIDIDDCIRVSPLSPKPNG